MIFVDSNVPMYLVGADHPHKTEAELLLRRAIAEEERLLTDAEVLQEILHRYAAIRRRDAIQPAFDALLGLVDEVVAIEAADAGEAKDRLLADPRLSARDALHLAVMRRRGVRRILTFDADFDRYPEVVRLGVAPPARG
jgi:predicted nucleic acid-binding protein